jgi:predicted Zn-ribbon and HTH transcriptional regulator
MSKEKRSSPLPQPRTVTVRESIRRALLDRPLSARDLSQIVAISEREVAGHLGHLDRSLKHSGETLVIEPPACLDCGFAFTHRHRFTRPSGCPKCRGRRISLPQFRIESR